MSDANVKESIIRDSLSKNLHLLEPGLTLVDVEYEMENPFGSKGFIDILAKDRFGLRVVIEVKRSNGAARQAIHEIFKYFALYQSRNHLADHQLRFFVVSTTWRELRVPFDNFVRQTRLQIDGFKIEIDEDGNVTHSEKIQPLKVNRPFKLFHSHDVYLFEDKPRRDAAMPLVEKSFVDCGGESGLIIALDYEGEGSMVIQPFAIYVVTSKVTEASAEAFTAACLEDDPDFDPETPEGREAFETQITLEMQHTCLDLSDSFEIASHEKFGAENELGWNVKAVRRVGDFPDATAANNEELISLIAGYGGENAVLYHRIATPRVALAWNEIPNQFAYCLKGNTVWTRAANWFYEWVKANHPDAVVSISIYNLQDLIVSLFSFLKGRPDFLPYIEIVANEESTGHVFALVGQMRWDRTTRPESVKAVFTPGLGGLRAALTRSQMKDIWQIDEMLMGRHGLFYATYIGEDVGSGMELKQLNLRESDDGKVVDVPVTSESGDMIEFAEENTTYAKEFFADMSKYTNW